MPKGRVIKAYSGHYYVSHGDTVVDCKLRGRLRKEDKDVLVGDMVSFTLTDPQGVYGVIEDLFPRKTRLLRPPVANVDQAVIVIACNEPEPDLELLDRILVTVAANSLDIVICLNKIDLVSRYAADPWTSWERNDHPLHLRGENQHFRHFLLIQSGSRNSLRVLMEQS
jgi:ribosome biogenesis GTPase